jgi:hypothetical protein
MRLVLRKSVETSLDAAGTSVRATKGLGTKGLLDTIRKWINL